MIDIKSLHPTEYDTIINALKKDDSESAKKLLDKLKL